MLNSRLYNLLILASVLTQLSRAQSTPEEFVKQYISAARSGDVSQIKALIHPTVLSCINDSTREFFDTLLAKDVSGAPTPGYKITITPIKDLKSALPIAPDFYEYKVEPSQQVQFDWKPGPFKLRSSIRMIAREGNRWFLVYPCPTVAGMKTFREQNAKKRQQEERARKLSAEMDPSLKTELEALLKQGHKLDAVKRYQAATGSDLTSAVQVINTLERQP